MKLAGVAQLVEHHLAKVNVASSSLVSRSNFIQPKLLNRHYLPQKKNQVPKGAIWTPGD